MKQRIFMYLFVFTLLLVIFQFVNSKNILNRYEADIHKLKLENKKLRDSTGMLQDKVQDLL